MDSLKDLRLRFEDAKAWKMRWLSEYTLLYRYIIPNRDGFNELWDYQDMGKPTTEDIWDNTAMIAAYQRANDLHGLLMPKDRRWGALDVDPHKQPENVVNSPTVKRMLDAMNEAIFFYLNESNLSRVVSASNLDLIGGTAAIWVESHSDEHPLYFRSVSATSLIIENTTDDLIGTAWFRKKISGRQILKMFPKYNGPCLRAMKDNPNEQYLVDYGQIQLEEDKYYIYAVLDSDPCYPLFELERDYNQLIIYRDRVRPGEAEGRGVGMDMLPTVRDLNRVVEYSRKSMANKAYPPMFYDADKFINPFSIRQWAGAMIPRNPQSGRDPITVMQTPEHPEVLAQIQHLQEVIQRAFQVDPLGEIQTPVRSATEVSIRENRAQRTSATDISRLINELPKQVFEVSAKILNARGLLTKERQKIPGFNTRRLKFVYKSPLYDLQNQEDLNHLAGNLQMKQQFFGEGSAVATVNLPELNDFLTEKFNLPSKLFKTGEEINQFVQAMAQAAQPQPLPQPSTSASPVSLPEAPGVTI